MNPILVEVYRAEVLESFHRGVICMVNENGEIIFSKGDPHQICYPRSAMKLLQVLPLIMHGGKDAFGFTLAELAIMCGSHNGELEHLSTVRSILSKIGCDEKQLECGAQYPTGRNDANNLIKNNAAPTALHNNCSGKHAGMLALCKLLGFETKDYIHPDHPVQLIIMDVCAKMYEYPKEKMVTALDGCSAPIYSVPVWNQAIAFKNIALYEKQDTSLGKACKLVIEAISAHPFMVAGSNRYCTDMLQITAPTVIGKTGAEGVFCMSFTKQNIGVCIKIDDGKMLPQYNVAQAILESSKLFSEQEMSTLHHYRESELTNFNKLKTGTINTSLGLMDEWIR